MDYFESLVKTLLEQDGYWVRQSYKVHLTPEQKVQIGKPSMPRPEIDLLACKPTKKTIIALEVKSYLDSIGVRYDDLDVPQPYTVPQGRYKLFTCQNYRKIVFDALLDELIEAGMAEEGWSIQIGLAAGKIHQNRADDLRRYFYQKGWFLWTPEEIRDRVSDLATIGYENDPVVIAAKLLERNRP